ncbi:pirin [Streptomyces erythrochromogenes]|uniref:pirin n=1 Tax=Streptomyces erythrochromogenes TaxID=285574 RepID=UPI00332F46E0
MLTSTDPYASELRKRRAIQGFWNWIGRSHEEIAQFREDWTNGTRYGEVKGYDGPPIPAPQLPSGPLKARGRVC